MRPAGIARFDELERFRTPVNDMLARAVARWPDRPVIVDGAHRLTYRELDGRVDRAARSLLSLQVRPGDRVALWMSNVWEWIVVQFAVTRIGAVLTPLNTRLRVEDLRHARRDCGACVLFTQARALDFSYVDTVRAILRDRASVPNLRHVVVARQQEPLDAPFLAWAAFEADAGAATPQPESDPRQLAYILYTSGTTSLPKGVMLSHASLNNSFNLAADLEDGDVAFLAYPLFAITGCHNTVLATILVGGGVVLQERFDAAEALRLIERNRCTVIGGIIYVLQDIASLPDFDRTRVASLRLAMIFPRRPEHLGLLKTFGLRAAGTGYGMTETCAHTTYVSSLDEDEMAAEGRPWVGSEVRIVGPDGCELPPGEDGDLQVRSPQLMMGYFNKPEATAAALRDGWLHTGDIGRLDSQGRLTWIGRHSDVYKCSGFNVASLEVEAFLARHPAVGEVAVLGVPDGAKGEVGAAFVVPRDGATLTRADLRGFCSGQIASYKIPEHVFVRPSLPKTASGKVRKVELKALFLDLHGASGR